MRVFVLTTAVVVLSGTPARVAAQNGVREVSASERGVIPLQTRLRYTTMVVLPDGEEILDVLCGDRDWWVISATHNIAHVKPAKAGPDQRPSPMLVLGETHDHTAPGPAARPEWLTIPQRGLYTGVMILGAVGTGKTSACMYPYVDQLLRWKADDPARKLGGLVLEVKGDFCGQVRSMLRAAGREDDYVEIGLDGGVCYNPLHNDLDPYAVAYAIATLLNNLFGRSKEPFWQQAYTDLLKFVILLRRIGDGYTTFSEVYRYIVDDQQIDRDIRRLKAELSAPPDVIVIQQRDYHAHCIQKPWAHWFADEPDHMAHPYEASLDTFLSARNIAYEVRKPKGR